MSFLTRKAIQTFFIVESSEGGEKSVEDVINIDRDQFKLLINDVVEIVENEFQIESYIEKIVSCWDDFKFNFDRVAIKNDQIKTLILISNLKEITEKLKSDPIRSTDQGKK